MTTTTKTTVRALTARTKTKSPTVSEPTPLWTMEERLRRIEAMGQRISGIIEFMCKVASLTGTSAEAKEISVTAFYEQMVVVERQLSRIQDDLRLG